MDSLARILQQNPELAIFLTIAVGFLIGRLKFGSFSLGVIVGCLLAGVLIGQFDIKVPNVVKSVFFNLFLFTTGYKVGPQFFRALKKDVMPQVAITLVLCVSCLLSAFVAAKILGYDIGTAAGLLAGAFSESTVIGTAGEAITRLALPDEAKQALINNIPIAYAVTYLVGTAVLVWYIPTIGPKLMGTDLKSEAAKLQSSETGGSVSISGAISAARQFDVRAYRVTNAALIGKSVGELEAMPKDTRAFVVRIRRGKSLITPQTDIVILEGDVVAVIGRYEAHVSKGETIGPEVSDPELLDLPVEALDVIVTNAQVDGKSLGELAKLDVARGVFVSRFMRSGVAMPIASGTVIDRGDVLRLIGPVSEVERVAKLLGYPDRATSETDMVFVGLGIFLGGLVGLMSLVVWGVPLTLTVSGGALVMGLVFGWLRSMYPIFGRIPDPAIWIFDTLGLCVFISIVGLNAGPSFISGLQKTGLSLVFVGLICALIPHTLAILFGRYVLRMNPLLVLGACAGAGTITAALRAVQEEAQSSYPALGYTVPYAIGNILLTAWGPILVAMMAL